MIRDLDSQQFIDDLFKLMKDLFPITRSITGNGVRKTLKIIQSQIPLKIIEIPSGTDVFDWKIPLEWNISDAFICNSKNEKIIDFKNSNLHVVQYSEKIDKKIKLKELKNHIHYLKNQPESIPYVTSYYKKNWGFCMSYNDFKKLSEDEYHVFINSSHINGSLTLGEYFIPGESKEEILISTYVCHPSMCNDNLSGPVLVTFLAKYLSQFKMHYSIRFLFVPETIGAISWLFFNKNKTKNIVHGLVATCLGDKGCLTYKKTRDGDNYIDQTVEKVLIDSGKPFKIMNFWPSGSDERQYCSPGFNLPVGSLMRTPYDLFKEYHTSDDNLEFMDKTCLSDSLAIYVKIISSLNNNHKKFVLKQKSKVHFKKSSPEEPVYLNLFPYCEPQLGKRNAYTNVGGLKNQSILEEKKSIQWILNLSDGYNSIIDIQKKSNLDLNLLIDTASFLKNKMLLKEI